MQLHQTVFRFIHIVIYMWGGGGGCMHHCLHQIKSEKGINSYNSSLRIVSRLSCARVMPVFYSSLNIRSTWHSPSYLFE